jgi:hypothetical protein
LRVAKIERKINLEDEEPRIVRAGQSRKEARTRWAKTPATGRPRAATIFSNRARAEHDGSQSSDPNMGGDDWRALRRRLADPELARRPSEGVK